MRGSRQALALNFASWRDRCESRYLEPRLRWKDLARRPVPWHLRQHACTRGPVRLTIGGLAVRSPMDDVVAVLATRFRHARFTRDHPAGAVASDDVPSPIMPQPTAA